MNARKLLVMLGMVGASAVAAAQTTAPAQPKQPAPAGGACKADVQRLCAGVQPGEGRIRACVRQHQQDLSAGCKAAISHRREEKQTGKQTSTS